MAMALAREKRRAGFWAAVITVALAGMIVLGSRNLDHFDAALVGYTFATLFAAFGITYRYAMWLQRPPTRMYWRRGWQVFLSPRDIGRNAAKLGRLFTLEFVANRFIWCRGKLRWGAHWLIMWGCILAAAITFPLVWGWIHFETVPGDLTHYRAFAFGFPVHDFPVESLFAFLIFHGLVWSSWLVIIGVMLAFRRRMIDHGAAAVQQFAEDILPLLLLFAISVTGLMLTASYSWMKGYAYDFLAILHAITVIFTLLWLPFGKFFHIFQRPAQLGAAFYKEAGKRMEQAECARCGQPFMSVMWQRDMERVERDLGFSYEMDAGGTGGGEGRGGGTGGGGTGTGGGGPTHYQQVCPKCRRALFGLAQVRLWSDARTAQIAQVAQSEGARL